MQETNSTIKFQTESKIGVIIGILGEGSSPSHQLLHHTHEHSDNRFSCSNNLQLTHVDEDTMVGLPSDLSSDLSYCEFRQLEI